MTIIMKKITILLFLFVSVSSVYSQFNYFGTNVADNLDPHNIATFNGKVYFEGTFKKIANTIYYDREIGYFNPSDNTYGEFANINTIEDFTGSSLPTDFFEFENHLYFVASSGANLSDRELYRTDGITVELFKDIAPGNLSGFPINTKPNFIVMNGKLYFFATNTGNINQISLWQTDGTTANTINISTVSFTDYSDLSKKSIIVFNNELYFSGYDNLGAELYKFNDISNTTSLIKDINLGFDGAIPTNFTIFNNQLFFSAYSTNIGSRQIFKTDGTTVGTTEIIDSILFSRNPNGMIVVNDKLVYVAFNPNTNTTDLFKCEYNLSSNNYEISLLKHFNPGPNVTPLNTAQEFILFNGNVYFSTSENSDYLNGDVRQVYKTDGTTSGTIKTITINASQIGSGLGALQRNFFIYNGKLCFYMRDSGIYEQVWISDGTNNYLETLTNIGNGLPTQPELSSRVTKDNFLYINATSINPFNGIELWQIEDTTTLTIVNFNKSNKISIYPNPASDFINIKIVESVDFSTEIYNMLGKKVRTYKNQKTINISNLTSGIYILKIFDSKSGQITTEKIIKQ